jgi:hypothetical protein
MATVDPTRVVAVEPYDLFISYHRNDLRWARQVSRALEKRGLEVWLDELNLSPGDVWRKEIARALDSSHAFGVLVGPSGLGGWQELEVQTALENQPARNRRIVQMLLPGAPRSATTKALLAPSNHCDLRGPDLPAQLDRLAARLLVERELREQQIEAAVSAADPNAATTLIWLEQLFRDAGKRLFANDDDQHVANDAPAAARGVVFSPFAHRQTTALPAAEESSAVSAGQRLLA